MEQKKKEIVVSATKEAKTGEAVQASNEKDQAAGKTERLPGAEDKVLKVAMRAFGESVMSYLGQEGQIKWIAPTEHIHLEMKHMYEDFNYEMDGGSWRHYEFESDRISVEDMRRFREYEAYLSMTNQVPVITTVLCSADVKNLRSELTEGINTYKVETVRLKDKDADKILAALTRKVETGERVSLEELVPMLLTPLMSGELTVYERIRQGFRLLKDLQVQLCDEDVKKMQAILYAFACKFLNRQELESLKEEIGMTVLGELLMQDGIEKGIEKGAIQTLGLLVKDGILNVKDAARRANLSEEIFVQKMKEAGY